MLLTCVVLISYDNIVNVVESNGMCLFVLHQAFELIQACNSWSVSQYDRFNRSEAATRKSSQKVNS